MPEQRNDTKRRQAVQRFQECVLAYGIIDNGHFLAPGDLFNALHEILSRIDDRMSATVVLGEFCLLIAADRADHGGTEMLRPLAQDQADTARGGMQQDGISGFNPIGLADQILHRQTFEHHRGCGLVIDAVGQLQQTVRRDQPRFGIGAERRSAVGDAVARLQIGDTSTDFLDHTRRLAAQPTRQLYRIQSRPIVDVDEVQPYCGMADARLARTGLAQIEFFPNQNFGAAGFMKADGVRHGTTP